MAQIFKVNDSNITHITDANWVDQPGAAGALDGNVALRASRTHTWTVSEAMPASIFDLLSAQEGATVRLTTTDYGDRNAADYVEYPGAVLQSVRAQHPGPEMAGVLATFLVRV